MSKDANTAKQGRCASCKAWKRHEGETAKTRGEHNGACSSRKIIDDDYYPLIQRETDALFYRDGEGLASVSTGSDFGCIHWEKSE